MSNIKSRKIFLLFILFNFGMFLNTYLWYVLSYREKKESIDLELKYAAENIHEILPKNFHNKSMSEKDYDFNELYEMFSKMHEKAKEMNVDYLYTFIKKNGEIYFASLSGNDKELRENESAYYFFPLKKAKDSSYDVILEIFDKPQITYVDKKDMWDKYRSIYIPKIAEDGTMYIAVADISKKKLDREIHLLFYYLSGSIGFLLVLVSPIILAFKTYKKTTEKAEKNFHDLVEHDELSGVYKREMGFKFIEKQIFLYKKYGIQFSILIVDINGLREVNSKEGLKNGDNLIRVLANILKSIAIEDSKVFRLNEDDFIVVSTNCTMQRKNNCLNEIMEKVRIFNNYNKKNLILKLNVAFLKYENEGLDSFIELAIQKLNETKQKGDYQEVNFQHKIREGLGNKEFYVCYQPKVNVLTKEVDFEALLRWKNNEGKNIPPDEFIPIAEKSYLIFLLTEFVLNEVMEAILKYQIKVSVNLSPAIIEKNGLILQIFDQIKGFSLKENIVLEITEGVAIRNLNNTLEKIKNFNQIGVHFSMDDFGTGYSSLSNLSAIPMSEVKIDKSIVKMIAEREENRVIIEMIVRLGQVLGFQIVAEGVESIEHLKILKELGCYIFQGYYFDKPIPIDEVAKRIEDKSYIKKMKE